jgi:hypothetical protein
MILRTLVVVLIAAATTTFVAGLTVAHDRNDAAAAKVASGELPALQPVDIDFEQPAFIVAVALVSLALALAAFLLGRSSALLVFVTLAMLMLAALDVVIAFHERELGERGLLILLVLTGALHACAAIASGVMARVGPA